MGKIKKQIWYEQEELWKTLEPALFNKERLESAGQEVEQIISLLKLQPGASVCDLCCGLVWTGPVCILNGQERRQMSGY
jgi:hypothetical protein